MCNDAVVCWAATFQFLRLLQLAQHVMTVVFKQ
jgi:tRNA threonylcarbamoyladenosine modification (KEOPS) complex  Pcc1 subunit